MTVLERLRGLNNHGCAYVTEDQSDRLCPCEMRLWQHLPTLLALAEAVKEAVDGSWKIQVHADREIQAFERDDVANIRKALAELEKEAV